MIFMIYRSPRRLRTDIATKDGLSFLHVTRSFSERDIASAADPSLTVRVTIDST